jgi:hypothetical protein
LLIQYTCLHVLVCVGILQALLPFSLLIVILFQYYIYTVFSRVICALFFPVLAAEKSGCVKYADFFCGVLNLGFILVF